ncbi:MAG: helix-turn-helix domain-containing protein [Sphingomonadales bacterium]|nr:helix-turn-helix domain-containing protein [Sphingomonadales bacterium]
MIRRTASPPKADGQLGLPFDGAETSAPPVQVPGDPISVRVAEAIRLTGIGRSKLYELMASGDIETIKVGRCTLIPMTSLRALVRRGAP